MSDIISLEGPNRVITSNVSIVCITLGKRDSEILNQGGRLTVFMMSPV